MKKIIVLVLVMLGFTQVGGVAADYSKMAASELNGAFAAAIKKGSDDDVRELIRLGANPHQEITYAQAQYDDYDRQITCTPLEYAAKLGHVAIVKQIIQAKPKVEAVNAALILAAKEGYSNVTKELIQAKPKVEAIGEALTVAAREGNANVVTELIKAKPKAAAINEALILAARQGNAGVVKGLINAKANVNHISGGKTALIEAIENHNLNAVEALLSVPGINLKYADSNGNTALIRAFHCVQCSYISGNKKQYNACVNSQKILEKLLQTPGSNPHHANKRGETAVKLLAELKSRPGF